MTSVPKDDVAECQVCDCIITTDLVDGLVKGGPWAYMCLDCHQKHGVGLGTGRGQRYKLQDDNFVKVEG